MKFKEVLGIDVSKLTIDVHLYQSNTQGSFSNNIKGYIELIKWAKRVSACQMSNTLLCFEHTGMYSLPLATFLDKNNIIFTMISALEIKRSLGLVRGKNDAIDAKRIAEYGFLRREFIEPYKLPSKHVLKLQKLLSLRDKLVRQKSGFMASLKESKAMLVQAEHQAYFNTQKKMMTYLSKQIKGLEKDIMATIHADQRMKELYDLITSVCGIGIIVAANFLVLTNCFTSFSDSRKFACYAGIAPFEKQSGTSLKTRAKVSPLANKKMKALLNLSAGSSIQADPELKAYYLNRVEKGKSKMSTLNIVRNKLVHRVFAVVKRGTPYVKLAQHAA